MSSRRTGAGGIRLAGALLGMLTLATSSPEKADSEKPIPVFKTLDGKEYFNVTITGATPSKLKIQHQDGMVSIPFENLPKEIQEKHGFEPEKSKAFEQEQDEKRAAQVEAAQAAALQAKLEKDARPMRFIVMQRHNGGILVNNVVTRISGGTSLNRVGGGGGAGLFESTSPGDNVFFVNGMNAGVPADGEMIEGRFVQNGTITYETVDGVPKTVEAYLFVGPPKKPAKK